MLTATIGTLTATIGTLTATIGTLTATIGTRAATIGTLTGTTGTRAATVGARAGMLAAALLVGTGPPPPPAAAQTGWDPALAAFSEQLATDVEDDGVGGMVAGVVVDGDLVWARAYGWADRERGIPMSTSSVLRTGSISKSITAVLMMRLVDRGVIGLDEPVRRYLPAVDDFADRPPAADPITFRHLASHTAGLIREPRWPGAVVGPIESWEKRVLESIPLTAYDTVPGARYRYSNIGFGTLGLALSRAAGKPFIELVREEIFEPLGMTGTAFVVVGAELEPRLATGYVRGNDGTIDAERPAREHAGRGYKVPNGGVYSTVADLGRFLGAMSGVPGLRILSEESRREALTVQTPEDPEAGYGLGFAVRIDEDGNRIVGHGGSVAGYNAYMAVDPDARIGVVLLRNYNADAADLVQATQRLIAELGTPPRPR
jgi:CubicO group peptidase (beta-lactamase class C family)